MRALITMVGAAACTTLACGNVFAPAGGEKKPAPALELELVNGGGTFSLEDQKGKVLLVDLWATWCAPCIAELPHLQKLSESYDPKEFTMVGIVLESGGREDIQDFIKHRNITYPNLLGKEGTKESFGPFLGYPTKYLIDKQGYVVKRYFGAAGDQVMKDVERLVRTGTLQPAP